MKSSVGRKILMALSGFFLLVFLLQHFTINMLSVASPNAFNETSHFMGTNGLIQFLMQPLLIFGVVFHFIMGFILESQNKKARGSVKYAKNNAAANSTFMSRNMIYSGLVVLLFLGLHFYDFWLPEINTKYVKGDMSGMLHHEDLNKNKIEHDSPKHNAPKGEHGHGNKVHQGEACCSGAAVGAPTKNYRYWEELHEKFKDPVRVGLYALAFVFLALHLLHGFQSAFQSVGFRHNKYTPAIKALGKAYAIVIPLGFIFIALFHHLTH